MAWLKKASAVVTIALLFAWLIPAPLWSQGATTLVQIVLGSNGGIVSSSNPMPVTGSFSATLSGFTPNGNFASLTASGTSGTTTLPSGTVVAIQNTGTTTVSCTLGVTAVASQLQVPPSSTIFVTVGANTAAACIDQTGSTSNVVALAGGTGLGTGFGGGGGSGGGGGGAVFGPTANGSVAANPPVIIGGTANGTGTGAVGNWKVDSFGTGWVDAVTGGQLLNSLSTINTSLGTLNTTAGNPLAAGTNIVGKVGIDQTTPGTTNGVQVNAGSTGGATSGSTASGVAANTDNCTNLKASAGTVYDAQTGNINASTPYYLKFYNKATTPVPSTDAALLMKRILIPPANSGNNPVMPVGTKFTSGIGFCIVTGIADTDDTAVPAATVLYNIDWN